MSEAADSVAVLSDIHGVLPVLDAVLAEPEVRAADLIVVCGDHAAWSAGTPTGTWSPSPAASTRPTPARPIRPTCGPPPS
jgi:hypothetical protein